MRATTLLAIGAAVLIAACSDEQASSPTSPRRSSGSVAKVVSSSSAPTEHAKPSPGFTTITQVESHTVTVGHGLTGGATATCPAGTTVVGGGYRITLYISNTTPPWITRSESDLANGWAVWVDNGPVGSTTFTFVAYAYCLS